MEEEIFDYVDYDKDYVQKNDQEPTANISIFKILVMD